MWPKYTYNYTQKKNEMRTYSIPRNFKVKSPQSWCLSHRVTNCSGRSKEVFAGLTARVTQSTWRWLRGLATVPGSEVMPRNSSFQGTPLAKIDWTG